MKAFRTIAFIFATAMAAPIAAYATEESVAPVANTHVHHHHHYRAASAHKATPELATAAPTVAKPVAPPAVENDSDGLSRDGDDCNKGCLDNTE